MTTISLDAAVNAVLGDEATARHWAVLGKQCRDPDARVARCREARALLREQRVSQGDNVKALCELRELALQALAKENALDSRLQFPEARTSLES